jgi:hypothetical protein
MNRRCGRPLVLASALLLACSTTQTLAPRFQPPELPAPERVLSETIAAAAASKPLPPPAIVVGIGADPPHLFAWDQQGKLLWQQAVAARSVPLIAGHRVVLAEAHGIVVRDLQTGASRAVLEDEADLVGADGIGDELAIALRERAEGSADVQSGLVAFIAGDDVRWRRRLSLPVGTPALVAGRVLIPWATQRLSILDARGGDELARFQAPKAVLGHALVRDGRVYIGQHQFWPLGDRVFEAGSKDGPAPAAIPLRRSLPAQPPLMMDGYARALEPNSAVHHLRVDWELNAQGTLGDALFLRFYRLLFAFDAGADHLRAVHVLARDIVGAAVVSAGIVVADAGGELRLFGHDGTERPLITLGQALQVVALANPEQWARGSGQPAAAAQPSSPSSASSASSPSSPGARLAGQLARAATLEDDRLLEGRTYAAQRLAAIGDPTVTRQLVELCSKRGQPDPVRRAACEGLARRPDGGAAVLAALELGVDEAPPLSALVNASVRMQLRRAGPLLLQYAADVRTGATDLPQVISALAALEHKPAAPALERFLRMHHAEPEGSEWTAALTASSDALGTLQAQRARATLERIAGDGFTQPALRASAQRSLATLKAGPPKPKLAVAKPVVAEAAPTAAADPRPAELSAQLVDSSLAPLKARLAACLDTLEDKPPSGRVSLVVGGDGTIERVFVTPAAAQACIEPLLRAHRLPATRGGMQTINHVVRASPPR